MTRVLIIGASGLLGSACMRIFNESPGISVTGTFRSQYNDNQFSHEANQHYFLPDVFDADQMEVLFENLRPSVVINCTSLSKRKLQLNNPLEIIPLYALFPHMLANLCNDFSARLIQISSDGIFSGNRGGYNEKDIPDATDLYGRAKLLGEVDGHRCVTLRTSIIGHDSKLQNGLVGWLLSQEGTCSGFSGAIFSGFPATVLARIIRDYVLTNSNLEGVYHLASEPISKFTLLQLIAEIYNIDITIVPDDSVQINRSLDASNFNSKAHYTPPPWSELITLMRDDYFRFDKQETIKNVCR